MVAKRGFTELAALGDGSASAIYLYEQIVSGSCRATGHPGKRSCHVGDIEFRNSRCDEAWGIQIGSGPGGGTESVEDSVWVVVVLERVFAELDAFGDRSTDAIYLGE